MNTLKHRIHVNRTETEEGRKKDCCCMCSVFTQHYTAPKSSSSSPCKSCNTKNRCEENTSQQNSISLFELIRIRSGKWSYGERKKERKKQRHAISLIGCLPQKWMFNDRASEREGERARPGKRNGGKYKKINEPADPINDVKWGKENIILQHCNVDF